MAGRRSRGPPSRERESWILVSLVLRVMEAVRRGKGVLIIVGGIECGGGGERNKMERDGIGEDSFKRLLVRSLVPRNFWESF